MAKQTVAAPPALPPLYGLVIGAPAIENIPDDVWGGGGVFAPEGCGNAGRLALSCLGATGARTPAANTANVEFDPFLVWASDKCSTLGFMARDFDGRARRQLAASESFQIAEELWTGELSIAQGLDNRYLVDATSDTVTDSATSATAALSRLVAALGQALRGQTGMIHVTPQVLVHLAGLDLVYRDGNIWRTPMGHRVIADDGYDGSGPGGVPATTSQWMYATSTIRVARGPVEVPGTFNENVDPYQNSVVIYAQRMAAYEWSNVCAHFAAEVDIDPPLVGAPS